MTIIKIGKYKVDKDDAWLYIQHFGRDKSNIALWEKMRKQLHDYIFEKMDIDRHSSEGIKFSHLFDEWAEPHILKYDPISAKAKKLVNSKTDAEIKASQTMLQIEMARQNMINEIGARNFTVDDKTRCRICKKELGEGIPRFNDHLLGVPGFKPINAPICSNCATLKPDDYHIAFKNLIISNRNGNHG